MTQQATQPSRMDLRIPQEVRDIIDHAATMEGRTRTDFVIAATDFQRGFVSRVAV